MKSLAFYSLLIFSCVVLCGSEQVSAASPNRYSPNRLRPMTHNKNKMGTDSLGSFQINDYLSNYNQSRTLGSSVLKKKDETTTSQAGKIK